MSQKFNEIDEIKDGTGKRVTRDFLQQLLKGFAEQSLKHINFFDNSTPSIPPFAYREKQLHSVIAPAICEISDSFLMECPVSREWSKKEKNLKDRMGWLDYWCRYRDFDFFIELKHSYFQYDKSVRKETIEKWKESIKQLSLLKAEAKDYGQYCNGVISIALEVVTIFDDVKTKGTIPLYKKSVLEEMQEKCFNELKPKPDWSGIWILDKESVKRTYFEYDESTEVYPAVIMVAKVKLIC